ncbi:MAG TPA: glycosyltransferase family 87 protein [Roseiflexaceae bacterium]|nr:glycosyltransferase family 87 protein [Roseiflexaceae bacterium]
MAETPARWTIVAGLVLIQALLLLLLGTALLPSTINWHLMDLDTYANASGRLLDGMLPYRDFRLEYPPFAIVAFLLPHLLAFGLPLEGRAYDGLFGLSIVVYSTLTAVCLSLLPRRWPTPRGTAGTLGVYALFVAIMAPLLPWRYDLFPALLTLLGFIALLDRRPLASGLLLGLGVAAKLYPLVIIALFGTLLLARRDLRGLLWLALGSAGGLLLGLMPFLLITPEGLLSFLSYHELRGLQIESGAGSLICLLGVLGLITVEPSFSFGAFHLASPLSDPALALLTPLFLLALGALLLFCFRQERRAANRPLSAERLAGLVAAVLLVFMITNKVFSPQYIIWLLPFIPLLPRRQVLFCGLVCGLTIVLFPFLYGQLLALLPGPVLMLSLRNLLVLLLIPWLLAGDRSALVDTQGVADQSGPLTPAIPEEG